MATSSPNSKARSKEKPVELFYSDKKSYLDILTKEPTDSFECVYNTSTENRLYCGDNINGLKDLLADPAVKGKVTLVYIDPPFATKGAFYSRDQRKAYEDDLCGADYVESLRERLVLIRELLSPSGSIYLHLDENMVFEMKLIMDEIFGHRNYRNTIIRKKCNPKNYTRKSYGNIADFILFYSKSDEYVWNRPVEPLSEKSKKEYQYVEPATGRRFMKVPIHAPGTRNGETGKPWRGKLPPKGKHWQYIPNTLDEMDARGEIYWSKTGNPRRKVYLDKHQGVSVQDIWMEYKDAHNQNVKITGYPTEKNPDLLKRIVLASSNPGDLVLDCYAGSGTTLAVADEMQRNWIGMDQGIESITTILRRFHSGLERMGDYVSVEKSQRNNPDNQLGLFELSEDMKKTDISFDSDHISISQFSVFIEKNRIEEFCPLMQFWIDQKEDALMMV